MALSVSLLKVYHLGMDEARKVLPYTQKCDIFSLESMGMTDDAARTEEAEWLGLIGRNDVSRNLFSTSLKETKDRTNGPNIVRYCDTVMEYIFRQKIPIWHTERYATEREADTILRLSYDSNKMFWQGIDALSRGAINGYFDRFKRFMEYAMQRDNLRDQNIGHNLSSAEEKIRADFPTLREKELIRLALFLGYSHTPEKHTPIPIHTDRLVEDQKVDLLDRITGLLYESMDRFEELKEDILRVGALQLSKERKWAIPQIAIQKMSYKELSEKIRSLREY